MQIPGYVVRRISKRDQKRIATSKIRHGEDVFRRGGQKGARIKYGGLRNPL